MYNDEKNVPRWAFIPVLLGFLILTGFLIVSESCGQQQVEKLKKEAIHHSYATYDEAGEFKWIEPTKRKESAKE